MTAYATAVELDVFLPDGVTVTDADRQLERASTLLDEKVRRPFALDVNDLPTDLDIKTAMRDACCAQVEFWLEVGEEHDIEGLANRPVQVGHLNVPYLPPELAPRAYRILHLAGMLSAADDGLSAPARFFATPSGS